MKAKNGKKNDKNEINYEYPIQNITLNPLLMSDEVLENNINRIKLRKRVHERSWKRAINHLEQADYQEE